MLLQQPAAPPRVGPVLAVTDVLRCVDEGRADVCAGVVELRESLSPTGVRIARCELHWSLRLTKQDEINRRYPNRQPDDFDPLYAGESWDEPE